MEMMADPAGRDDMDARGWNTFYEGTVQIPGYGKRPDRCRDYTPVGFCEDGHVHLGQSSCQTRFCPSHWRDWTERAVVKIVERLAAYRQVQPMGSQKRLSHVVVSPPQDDRYSARAMYKTRTDAYDALRDAGVRGGSIVTHPFRVNEDGKHLCRTLRQQGEFEENTGDWRILREVTDGFDELEEYITAEPHYHCLAAAEDIDSAAAPDDWIVERIRTFSAFHPRDSEAYEDMARTAYYLLTHGAVGSYLNGDSELVTGTTTTYFGEVHPNAFNPSEELTTALWDRIQREAEAAVGVSVEDEKDGDGGQAECPRDDCEALLRPLEDLDSYLSDVRQYEGWFRSLDFEQQCEIWGLWTWLGDTPPPGRATEPPGEEDGEKRHDLPPGGLDRTPDKPTGAVGDKQRVLTWVRRLGRKRLHQKPGYEPPEDARA